MRNLQWSDDHSVLIPELDEQHKGLLEAAQELRTAVLTGESKNRVEFLAGRMATRLAAHFRYEEGLMRGSRYSAMDWHERQHQTARAKLARLWDAVRGRGAESILGTLEELADWSHDHVTVADRMLAAHVRNNERERIA
ncbi:MAG TPA: hemerythrin family protein [Bryobacteraceae bacterium]